MLCLAVIDQHEVGATACDTSSEETTFTTKEDTKFSNEYCPRGTVFIIKYCTRGDNVNVGGGTILYSYFRGSVQSTKNL